MAVSGEAQAEVETGAADQAEAEADRTLEELAGDLRSEATEVLSARRLRFWPRCASPELRKVLASLPEALDEIGRLLGRRAEICPGEPLDDVTAARLKALLSISPAGLDPDSAWQQLEGLQSLFLTLGAHDVAYVRSVLDVERGLEKRRDDDWEEPWPYYGWGRIRWRQVFPTVPVDEVPDVDDAAKNEALGVAVERLHKLFRMRVENGRKRRTRLALRNRFFVYSLLVLGSAWCARSPAAPTPTPRPPPAARHRADRTAAPGPAGPTNPCPMTRRAV